jgi:hypothetical protein
MQSARHAPVRDGPGDAESNIESNPRIPELRPIVARPGSAAARDGNFGNLNNDVRAGLKHLDKRSFSSQRFFCRLFSPMILRTKPAFPGLSAAASLNRCAGNLGIINRRLVRLPSMQWVDADLQIYLSSITIWYEGDRIGTNQTQTQTCCTVLGRRIQFRLEVLAT